MKTGIALFALLTVVISVQAQEYDDMYFKSKDRAKLNGDKVATVRSTRATDDADDVQSRINPTDSYSGRNVNPEYTSRNTVTSTSTDEEDSQYFVSGYEPTGVNQSLSSYNSNSFYGPYSGNNAFASSYYGYGSGFGYNPVFANPYSSFANSYYWNSFYPGMSLGYSWGMGGGYYGMNMGYGSWGWDGFYGPGGAFGGWGSPYSGFGYYGYPSYGFYGYGGYYGYPTQVVVINNNNGDGRSGIVYGKRGSRSSDVNNQSYTGTDSRGRTRGSVSNSTAANTGGRSSTTSQYYQSGWRSNPDVQRNIGAGSNSGRSSSWSGSGSSSSWRGGSNNGSGWSNSNSGGRSSWDNSGGFNNSNSSGSFGGGRSGGSFGGGNSGGASHSSGGSSRGRH